MAKNVTQVIENPDGNGGGTVTVIATDDNGYQSTATRAYYYPHQRADAITEATQEALNK